MKQRLRIYFLLVCHLLPGIGYMNAAPLPSKRTVVNDSPRLKQSTIFVDKKVDAFPISPVKDTTALQLISHGKPGTLLLDGRWRNAPEIVDFLQRKHLISERIKQLNIYGCEFGKGSKGIDAVAYIEKALNITVAASDDITGKDGDWILEVGAAHNVMSFPQYSGSLQYAPGDDLDGDGVINLLDIDDDNDGVLNADEAPNCYYTQAEATTIIGVTSGLTFTSVIGNAIDGNFATLATLTAGQAIANKVIYQFQFATGVRLSKLTDSLNSTVGIVAQGATYRIEASNSATGPWTDVSGIITAPANPGTGNHQVWTLPGTQSFIYYRIFGLSGNTAAGNSREFTALPESNYTPSSNPKPICATDTDNDGITNDKDLDSDGDGCPDAVEASLSGISGVPTSNGNIKNGANGIVTSTTSVSKAVISGPYGANGFAVSVQSASNPNVNAFNNTYNQYALIKTLNYCIDSDGDGVSDLVDIDDDNDGVLDVVEYGTCSSNLSGDGSFEGANSVAWTENTNTASLNSTVAGSGWISSAGSPDTWKGSFSLVGSGFWAGANNGVPVSPDGGVFASVYNGFTDETISTTLGTAAAPLQIGATYKLSFYQVFGGTNGITTVGRRAMFKFKIGTASFFGDTMTYNGNNYKTWTQSQITFVATATTQVVTVSVIGVGGGDGNYLSLDGVKLFKPQTPGCDIAMDTDNDGIINALDLDSDGDGCTDAREAGTYNKAGVTVLDGLVKNGANGIVTSTVLKPAAIINRPYGNNGFADILQSATDTNAYKYTYSYAAAISSSLHANCNPIADTVTIRSACPTCPVTTCMNHNEVDSAGATYSSCGAPAGYTLTASGACFTFKPNGAVTNTTRSCIVICNNGICDTTYITLLPPITPDSVAVTLTCPTCPVKVCVVADDIPVNATTTYSSCGLSPYDATLGTIVSNLHGCLIWQGNGAQTLNDTIRTCIVACNGSVCDTTYVSFNPPIPPYGSDTITVQAPGGNTPTAPICPTGDDLPAGYTNPTYHTCGLSATDTGFGVLSVDANGCAAWIANSTQTDTVKTCVVKCADTVIDGIVLTVCDTTRIYFLPPPVADTVIFTPACPSCEVVACPTANDIEITSESTFSTCGATTGYTIVSGPTAAGCFTFMPDPLTPPTDTARTCVVVCNGRVCDTTYVMLAPPISPDTVTLTPLCPSCPVNVCAVVNDVDPLGATYSSCGTPAGYDVSVNNGCYTYTAIGAVIDTAHTCIVMCNNGKCDTTYVTINPPITPDTVTITPTCDTCPVEACVVVNDVKAIGAVYYTCGDPVGYTSTSVDGCFSYVSTIATHQTTRTCIVMCNNEICDTTYVTINPFTNALPINIINFSGKALENKNNQLSWTAVDEADIASYSIQKSSNQQNWKKLGTLTAKGSADKQSYSMIDENPDALDFYRLILNSKSGDETVYPKVVLIRASNAVADQVNVYPNPADTKLNLEYNSASGNANVHIFITDITGRKVKEMDNTFGSGKNVLQLDINGLAEGSYLINYYNAVNGNNGTIKFVKSKK